eukprot:scaffold467839_cov17-Prasinocladus_malaysianus.AAC.1
MILWGPPVIEPNLNVSSCFQDAYDAGHWRAGHSLAAIAETTLGGPPNCTRAAELMRGFISERFTWVDGLVEAQRYFDSGKPSTEILRS